MDEGSNKDAPSTSSSNKRSPKSSPETDNNKDEDGRKALDKRKPSKTGVSKSIEKKKSSEKQKSGSASPKEEKEPADSLAEKPPTDSRQSPARVSPNDDGKVTKSRSGEKVKKTDSGKAVVISSKKNSADDPETNSKKQRKGSKSGAEETAIPPGRHERKMSRQSQRSSGTEPVVVRESGAESTEAEEKRRSAGAQEDKLGAEGDDTLHVSNEALTAISMESMSSKEDLDDDAVLPENIVWEWEQELEEYDEPDVYPSEKDYIMVPTQVEMTSEDEAAEEEAARVAAQQKEKAAEKVVEKVEGVKKPVDTIESEALVAMGDEQKLEEGLNEEAKAGVSTEQGLEVSRPTVKPSDESVATAITAETRDSNGGSDDSNAKRDSETLQVEPKEDSNEITEDEQKRDSLSLEKEAETGKNQSDPMATGGDKAEQETSLESADKQPENREQLEVELKEAGPEDIDETNADKKHENTKEENIENEEKVDQKEKSEAKVSNDKTEDSTTGEKKGSEEEANKESLPTAKDNDSRDKEENVEDQEKPEVEKNVGDEEKPEVEKNVEGKEKPEVEKNVEGEEKPEVEKNVEGEEKPEDEAKDNQQELEIGLEGVEGEKGEGETLKDTDGESTDARKDSKTSEDGEDPTDKSKTTIAQDETGEEKSEEERSGKKENDDEEVQPGTEDGIKINVEEDEKGTAEGEEEEKKPKEKGDKKTKERKESVTGPEEVIESEDGGDPADDFDVPGLVEVEPDVVEPPPKKYKTVMVRTLVPRPPKIHYVPEEERNTHYCSDKHHFRKRPFSLVMSYGYDCQRMANLHVLDSETLVYMAGFVLTFYNHMTGEQSYLRCIGGSCFGALAIHPSKKLFAAAEKGENPIVGIWSWPKQQLFRKLRDGTNKAFASVNFSPCGKFLATQGGEPDYLITVYNWLAEMPVVRVKSHAQDVYRVTFSKELAGRLTTSGLCHIKFWKMATTFTGLKLKGDLGRFGRTELSDIEGYIEMPDGKVLSGTEWGNLLLWENGLIVAEICVRQDIPCHEGIVRQILHSESEFYTAGQDGWIRTWSFDAIDSAEINTTEESLKVAVKSSGQVQVGEHADVWYIVPDIPDDSSSSVFWFAQDGKGTIMCVDLSFLNTAKEPYSILNAHGGPIVACATSRINCLFASLGADGQIRVQDYTTHEPLASRTFSAPGTVLLWPGVHFDPNCCTLLAGFADGTFRVITLSGAPDENDYLSMSLLLYQVRKPHSRRLTCMDIDATGKYLATGGEDGTIFFFDIADDYAPLVFVNMPEFKGVASMRWMKGEIKETSDDGPASKLLAALEGGTLLEMMMPKPSEIDNKTTFNHMEPRFLRRVDFLSIKSELLHGEDMEKERVAEEQLNAALEVENRKRIDEGLESESQQNLRLLEEAEEMERIKAEMGPKKKWEPYIPPTHSNIALMIPSIIDQEEIFLSMDGFDSGYLYMMRLGDAERSKPDRENPREPDNATKFEDSKDNAVTAFTMTTEGDYIFWGFSDGRVRIQNLEYPYAIEHMNKHWTEGIHDCVRGKVNSICLDKDGVFLITAGQDGNCFLLSRLGEKDLDTFLKREEMQPVDEAIERKDVVDITDPNAYTLEIFKRVEKEMALLAEAKKNKMAKREEIARLRLWYHDILKKNNDLPEEFRLTPVELALTTDRESRKKEEYEVALKQLKFETAWNCEKARLSLDKVHSFYKDSIAYELFELRAFNSSTNVWSFRMANLPAWFEEAKDLVEHHVTPHSVYSDTFQEEVSPVTSDMIDRESKPKREPGMDKFVYQKLVRIWQRKQRKLIRARVWKDFLKTEPKGKDLREEDRAIEEASANMGDMKLKSAADYKVPESKKLTEHRGRKRMVKLEETVYAYKTEFNDLMLALRQDKLAQLDKMNEYNKKIQECQKVLSLEDIKAIPEIKQMVITENPNRTMTYTVEDVKQYKKQIEEKLRASAPINKVVKKQEGPPVKRKTPGGTHGKSTGASKLVTDRASESHEVDVERTTSLALGSFLEPIVEVLSPLEERIKRAEIVKAKFWQDHYIDKIKEEKMRFDAKLKLLRHRKLKLDYLLKIANERMVLLTQEFILAQQSEALEASLESKIHNTSKEKRDCTGVMKVVGKKLDNVKKEMDHFARQKHSLLNEVVVLATSRAPAFEKYLVKVFNKRMPRARSRPSVTQSNRTQDSDEDDSSDSSDDDLDMDDDEDDGLDPDFPPPELNKEVYDGVVEIRERRGKIDDSETSIKEQLEELQHTMNQYKTRVNAADRDYEKARRELDMFRKEKQEKQNVLNCAVSMKIHQIEDLGRDLSNALVVENRSIDRLMKRIPELQKEKVKQRMTGNDMKKFNLQLHTEKLMFQKRLAVMSKKCDQEMVRKFGQIRPVEELEFFSVDPRVANLKNEVRALEEVHVDHMRDLDLQIMEAERARGVEMMKSITRLNTVAYVSERVHHMNKEMEDQMKKLPSELEDTVMSREIAFLKVLLTDQWNTISALSLELAQLTKRYKQPLPPIGNPHRKY